jgi:hypothetical protein
LSAAAVAEAKKITLHLSNIPMWRKKVPGDDENGAPRPPATKRLPGRSAPFLMPLYWKVT